MDPLAHTGSLDVVSPDNEEEVSGTPSFVWADDAGEADYTLEVFDAYGNLIWTHDMPSVSGDENVSVEYAGDPLEAGMVYQCRATSFKQGGAAIARTEDLRGTFLYR